MSPERDAAPKSLAGWSYTVRRHDHIDKEFAEVVIHCIGYPTKGTQPSLWDFALKVPKSELSNWPLGASVRLVIS